MITSGGANVQLTAEQSLQLLEWQGRLAVIHNEIQVGEKALQDVKDETERRIKHLHYLGGVATELEGAVTRLTATKEELLAEVAKSQTTLGEHTTHIKSRNEALDAREAKVTELEVLAAEKHAAGDKHLKDYSERIERVTEREQVVEKAKTAFLEATKSVTWK